MNSDSWDGTINNTHYTVDSVNELYVCTVHSTYIHSEKCQNIKTAKVTTAIYSGKHVKISPAG